MKYEDFLINSKKIETFPANLSGRDFVVGDIHGEYDNLEIALKKVNFDKTKDRLFSVGDLVDRGMFSHVVDEYINSNWFFPIRGNHDEFVLRSFYKEDIFSNERWRDFSHGGEWFFNITEDRQREIAEAISNLPIAIEINTKNGLVVLVHANLPFGHLWSDIKTELNLNNIELMKFLQWNRERVNEKICQNVEDIYKAYIGHTVVKEPTEFGNVIAIDTGSGYSNYILYEDDNNQIYYHKPHLSIVEII